MWCTPSLPPLSLYIHFPWCIRKCPYCDFNSHTLKGELDASSYIEGLLQDLANDLVTVGTQRELVSIYMGGGTPSLFSGKSLGRLLKKIRAHMAFSNDIEITLEANPGTIEHDAFDSYLEAGINRLSLGAQSFNNDHLAVLGRIHDADSIYHAVQTAKRAGFSNINIDLMYGLPGQDAEMALSDCQKAIDIAPTHLSLYQLTIEPNTWFHRYPPSLPDMDLWLGIEHRLTQLTSSFGYYRYEVSAYALDQYPCRHNLNYWRFGDYLGIGAGAHSKLSCQAGIIRSWKQKHPRTYLDSVLNGKSYINRKTVPLSEIGFEFLMNALRLTDGFDLSLAAHRTGLTQTELIQSLTPMKTSGFLEIDQGNIKCSERGYLFLDELLTNLLPDP